MAGKIQVGVLALQGAVEPHLRALEKVGAAPVAVRRPNHLLGLSGIILPGGESTAMIHLLKLNQLWDPLTDFVAVKPTLGVCAGAILLAKEVTHPEQVSLAAMDLTVARNAFGRQVNSFSAPLEASARWTGGPIEGVFIRAPRITAVGEGVDTLFTYQGEPVMVEQDGKLAATFHPELTESVSVHEYFFSKCRSEKTPWMTASLSPSASSSIN